MTKTTLRLLPLALCVPAALMLGCGLFNMKSKAPQISLITLDPGHFHAYLVQKQMYPEINPVVHVYAPKGSEVKAHLKQIENFNHRADNPTSWKEEVFVGTNYLSKMLADKAGNVVVMAGNNARKAEYIAACVNAGLNVHSDKPMAITPEDYVVLKQALIDADQKGVLVRDIMTERYEITTILQAALSRYPELYGTQDIGTPENPAITKESVHHFCKVVAGKPLQRPAWFYDTTQQGQGIVDVTTHLVDLIQIALFPDANLKPEDVAILSAKKWATDLTPEQFKLSTGDTPYPDMLRSYVDNKGTLKVDANGEFTYTLRGVHAKVSVIWNFQAPAGAGDTHYSQMRGSKATLIIRQGADQGYKPRLYVEPAAGASKVAAEAALRDALAEQNKIYPGISYKPVATGWEIIINDKYDVGHEAHFIASTQQYIEYFKLGKMPRWETDYMLTKYYTTTEAYKLANAKK